VGKKSGLYRLPRKCRERWRCHLCPTNKKGLWSATDDLALLKAVLEVGKRWTKITKMLNTRTENAIKNRYASFMERRTQDDFVLSEDQYILKKISDLEEQSKKSMGCEKPKVADTAKIEVDSSS